MAVNIKDIYKYLQAEDIKTNLTEAIEDVNRNIADKSTFATNVRKITLVIDIQPNDERDQATVDINIKTALARRVADPRMVFLGKHEPLPFDASQPTLEEGKKKGKSK